MCRQTEYSNDQTGDYCDQTGDCSVQTGDAPDQTGDYCIAINQGIIAIRRVTDGELLHLDG